MAFVFQGRYEVEAEASAKAFYATLSERDRRRYVAVEARRLGYGAVTYLAEVFGCSQRTIDRDCWNWMTWPTTRRRAGCGDRAAVEKKGRVRSRPRTEPDLCAGGPHGRRPG